MELRPRNNVELRVWPKNFDGLEPRNLALVARMARRPGHTKEEDGHFAEKATFSVCHGRLDSVQDNGTGRIEVAEHRCR